MEIEELRSLLTDLPGVQTVDLSDFPAKITICCDRGGMCAIASEGIRGIVRDVTGLVVPTIDVEDAVGRASWPGRARFESVEVRSTGRITLAATVILDWQRRKIVGEAEGEASAVGELRTCCLATLRAVESAAARDLSFNLVGVKELHVFDHNLIAVLVHSPQLPGQRLIGTSIITGDRRKSAALAVLSATNRAFGHVPEAAEG